MVQTRKQNIKYERCSTLQSHRKRKKMHPIREKKKQPKNQTKKNNEERKRTKSWPKQIKIEDEIIACTQFTCRDS